MKETPDTARLLLASTYFNVAKTGQANRSESRAGLSTSVFWNCDFALHSLDRRVHEARFVFLTCLASFLSGLRDAFGLESSREKRAREKEARAAALHWLQLVTQAIRTSI